MELTTAITITHIIKSTKAQFSANVEDTTRLNYFVSLHKQNKIWQENLHRKLLFITEHSKAANDFASEMLGDVNGLLRKLLR